MNSTDKQLMTIPEYAEYAQVSVVTARRMLKKGEVPYLKIRASKGCRRNHEEFRIHCSNLSKEAQQQFLADRGLIPESKESLDAGNEGYLGLTAKQKDRFEENKGIVRIFLDALEGLPAGRKTAFSRQFAQGHGISVAKLWRLVRSYHGEGEAGLIPAWNCGEQKRRIIDDKEVIEFMKKDFMIESGPTMQESYERYTKEFKEKRDKLCSLRTYGNFINSYWTESERLLAREPDRWKKEHGLFINRDWDKVALNEVWFSDAKQIDIACLYRGRPIFPWLTAFMDAKSRKYTGWVLTASPDSWGIAQAFDYAISAHGVPKVIYIDRGMPYKSRLISGGRIRTKTITLFEKVEEEQFIGIFRELGIEVFFAYPRNAKEKIIEANFGCFTDRDRNLPGNRSFDTKHRPKKADRQIKQGKILTFEQLHEKINQTIEERNARPHSTTKKVPNDFYANYVPVVPSESFRAYLKMDRHWIKIRNSGVKIGEDFYRGEELWRHSGEEVEVRRDPADIRKAAVIQGDELLEICYLEPAGHYRDEITLANRKRVAQLNANIRRERKRLMGQHEASDPRKAAMDMGAEPKLLRREIRPAASVTSINKRERLARETMRELNKPEPEPQAQEAATGGRSIVQMLLGTSKPEPKKEMLRLIPDEELTGFWDSVKED